MTRCLCLIFFGLFLCTPERLQAAEPRLIGDRLVVGINDVPYTQRQIEAYISIKESLRQKKSGVWLIEEANWSEAIQVFTNDMIVLQESQRLGSFQIPQQIFDKYDRLVINKAKNDTGLKETVHRLGLEPHDIRRVLDHVLRISSFSQSKERQDQIAHRGGERSKLGKSRWFSELEDRSVVRYYKNARVYVRVQPTLGRSTDAR